MVKIKKQTQRRKGSVPAFMANRWPSSGTSELFPLYQKSCS
jgi:hypothetical protein